MRQHSWLGSADLSTHPESAEVTQCDDQHKQADRQPDAPVGQSEVDCVVSYRVVEEYGEDGAEGRRKECRKGQRKTHEQTGEPAKIAERNPEQVAGTKGARCGRALAPR